MDDRAELVEFDMKYEQSGYSFDQLEWAQCLLYMVENFDEMPEPERVQPEEPDQIQSNVNGCDNNSFGPNYAVLLDQINTLKI